MRRFKLFLCLALALALTASLLTAFTRSGGDSLPDADTLSDSAKLRHIKNSGDYPEELISLVERRPQTLDFVYEYPVNKDKSYVIDLSAEASCGEVPLLLEYDERWGYRQYAGQLFALSGCGPTALSMAALYLTGDKSLSPAAIAEFSEKHGYAENGNGSSWTLISEGAAELGMTVRELPLSEEVMRGALGDGELIILVVGPGDFTTTGHFLVVTGCSDSGFTLLDSMSRDNSSMTWSYERLAGQIENLWALGSAA